MSYHSALAGADWALEVIDLSDVNFDDVPRHSVMRSFFVKGDRGLLSEYLGTRNAGLLFINGCFSRRIEIQEPASLPIAVGHGDVELETREPLEGILEKESADVNVDEVTILPDLSAPTKIPRER